MKKNPSTQHTTQDTILESISDGVFTVDHQWKITSFNRAAEEITGIPRNKAIGQLCSEVFKSNRCETDCALGKTMKTSRPLINESGYIIDSDGKKIPISISTAVLKNKKGLVIGGVETFRDLSEVEALRKEIEKKFQLGDIISHSQKMCKVMEMAVAVATSPSTVLIEGDTGTGKELLARGIHQLSQREKEPFIPINCGALPDTLLESELFGYKKGAFTGAEQNKPGRFSLTKKGTLFLDEIGEISPAMQVRLLRVLQEKTFEPLGAVRSEIFQGRVIAASHKNLAELVKEGKFRQDLFYRINIMHLKLPSLNERKEDIPLLANHFLNKFNQIQNRSVPGISEEVFEIFFNHSWPGNVRELENVIERSFVLCGNSKIRKKHLPEDLNQPFQNSSSNLIKKIKQVSEKQVIIEALKKNNFNKSLTAKSLGIHKSTLFRKIKKLNISKS